MEEEFEPVTLGKTNVEIFDCRISDVRYGLNYHDEVLVTIVGGEGSRFFAGISTIEFHNDRITFHADLGHNEYDEETGKRLMGWMFADTPLTFVMKENATLLWDPETQLGLLLPPIDPEMGESFWKNSPIMN